eukprot:7808420-Alexandrium_andersonii.AAC.1
MAAHIFRAIVCGWTKKDIADLIEELGKGRCARKSKAVLLDEVSALCHDPGVHQRLCDRICHKCSPQYLGHTLRDHGVRVSRVNKKDCYEELVRLAGGAKAPQSATSAPTPSAPSESPSQQVVFFDRKARKQLRKRLLRRWMRRAVSKKIKQALKAKDWRGFVLSEIR